MKLRTVFMVAILCVAMLFTATACKKTEQLSPEQIRADALAHYERYCETVKNDSNLTIEVAYNRSRIVGDERYTEQVAETIAYCGLGTEDAAAVVKQQVAFGPYEMQYAEYYFKDTAYCTVEDATFRTSMEFQQFQSRHIPAILIDTSLYGTVEAVKSGDDTIVTFSGPQALEHWATDYDGAALLGATGTITVDKDGNVRNCAYSAQYTCGAVTYELQVSTSVKPEKAQGMEEALSNLPTACPLLSYFDAPRIIEQVKGDVYTAQALSAEYTESVYSEAFDRSRSRNCAFDTCGVDGDFMARCSYKVTNVDYTNTPLTNSEIVVFRDGICTSSVNGAAASVREGIMAETIRQQCKTEVLEALFAQNHLKNAKLTEDKGILRIDFAGNTDFANSVCANIYSVLNANLDAYTDSYTTPVASGYLCIDKATLLPTALGVKLERIHVAGEISYRLTFQLDQTMQLSSTDAYGNITGA
jgi:hypothetical protein